MCEMEWVIINTWPVELKMPRTCHRAPEKRKTIVSWRLSQWLSQCFFFQILPLSFKQTLIFFNDED